MLWQLSKVDFIILNYWVTHSEVLEIDFEHWVINLHMQETTIMAKEEESLHRRRNCSHGSCTGLHEFINTFSTEARSAGWSRIYGTRCCSQTLNCFPEKVWPNSQFGGTMFQEVEVLWSLPVTLKERLWPTKTVLHCQFWPQFLDKGIHPVWLPFTLTLTRCPVPDTFVMRTKLNLTSPSLTHDTLLNRMGTISAVLKGESIGRLQSLQQ
jgi:hypothetical protein